MSNEFTCERNMEEEKHSGEGHMNEGKSKDMNGEELENMDGEELEEKELEEKELEEKGDENDLNKKLKEKFETYLEKTLEELGEDEEKENTTGQDSKWSAKKHFAIQFGVFECRPEYGELDPFGKGNTWYLNSLWSEAKDEGIVDVDVEFAGADENDNIDTEVKVRSRKGNYDDFTVTDNLARLPLGIVDKNGIIPVRDLYPGFVPRHFVGTCMTRGGFTGWNWFTIDFAKEKNDEEC